MTLRKFLCAIGIHTWEITHDVVYDSPMLERLAVPTQTKQRRCVHCDALQEEDVHCLGLNPPEYVTRWFNVNG